MRRNNLISSDFYCTNCHKKLYPVWRKRGQEREPGHLKKLYCIYCKEEHNCIEIRPNTQNYTIADMEIEFEYNNFDEEGKRKLPYNKLKEAINNGTVKIENTLGDVRNSSFGKEYLGY